jgi:hypothetical protein
MSLARSTEFSRVGPFFALAVTALDLAGTQVHRIGRDRDTRRHSHTVTVTVRLYPGRSKQLVRLVMVVNWSGTQIQFSAAN